MVKKTNRTNEPIGLCSLLLLYISKEVTKIFIDKNLEMSSKLFKFANDNLLLTIGG